VGSPIALFSIIQKFLGTFFREGELVKPELPGQKGKPSPIQFWETLKGPHPGVVEGGDFPQEKTFGQNIPPRDERPISQI